MRDNAKLAGNVALLASAVSLMAAFFAAFMGTAKGMTASEFPYVIIGILCIFAIVAAMLCAFAARINRRNKGVGAKEYYFLMTFWLSLAGALLIAAAGFGS